MKLESLLVILPVKDDSVASVAFARFSGFSSIVHSLPSNVWCQLYDLKCQYSLMMSKW